MRGQIVSSEEKEVQMREVSLLLMMTLNDDQKAGWFPCPPGSLFPVLT